MGSLVLPLVFILLTAARLRGTASAHLDSESELTELKDLLDRLEDKLEAGERDGEVGQSFNEPNDDTAGDVSQNPANWESKYDRAMGEDGFGPSNRQPLERSLSTTRNKLRALFNAPRSFQRSSGCFGRRLDRIGSSSGLGCNRNRN